MIIGYRVPVSAKATDCSAGNCIEAIIRAGGGSIRISSCRNIIASTTKAGPETNIHYRITQATRAKLSADLTAVQTGQKKQAYTGKDFHVVERSE